MAQHGLRSRSRIDLEGNNIRSTLAPNRALVWTHTRRLWQEKNNTRE